MNTLLTHPRRCAIGMLGTVFALASWQERSPAADFPTGFSNIGGVANTRHNLTQNSTSPNVAAAMITSRNNYGEVCVYCHTPHGASTTAAGAKLPLWNRTIANTTFTAYSALNSTTITQTITQPGVNSIACLTCHDGQTAIDSIINMPGSRKYSAAAQSTHQEAFLDAWTVPAGYNGSLSGSHFALASNPSSGSGTGCLACHTPPGGIEVATDFTAFNIGTDLRNDHPVGITFPSGNPDFNPTTGTLAGAKYFDANGNSRMDKGEVRLYDTGDGYEVECATCHDPHGVPSGGPGSPMIPTFMRVANNSGSTLCLTCHVK